MERIGVRELRQNASRYLKRVEAGEDFQVTQRGKPVALLVPVPDDPWDELLASGAVRAPEEPGDLADLAPADFGVQATAALAAMREDER